MSNLGQECEAEYAWTLTETESEKKLWQKASLQLVK